MNDIGITKIEKLKVFIEYMVEEFRNNQQDIKNITDDEIKEIVDEFFKKKKINEIKDQLIEDLFERIVKIEDRSECTSQISELLNDFLKRIRNLEKLAKDPKIFKINIEKKLVMDK